MRLKTEIHTHPRINHVFGNPISSPLYVAKTLWNDGTTSTGFGDNKYQATMKSINNKKGRK